MVAVLCRGVAPLLSQDPNNSKRIVDYYFTLSCRRSPSSNPPFHPNNPPNPHSCPRYLFVDNTDKGDPSSSRGHTKERVKIIDDEAKRQWGLSMSSNPRAIHRAIGSQRERHFYHASNPKREGEEEEGAEKESERTEPPKVHMPPPRLRQIRRRRCAVV
jgi:hypothetical protein